jgi:aryl-alcohol dehydrogenase-like predicted oxidoreductase
MERHKLQHSGLDVSPLCFGGSVFGWTIDEATSFTLLSHFIEAGGNFIDTADAYCIWVSGSQGGESETIIGKWLKQHANRDRVVIATKVGSDMGPAKGAGLSRKYILQAIEDSLRRLQTDYIDLYQSHFDDEDTPMEETLEAYSELIRQGKVRAIGASNYTASRFKQALQVSQQCGYSQFATLQPLYNLYDRADYEQELEQVCREQEIGVISYYSLASGFLSGKYRSEQDLSDSVRSREVKKYLNDRGFRILTALDEIAQNYHTTATSVALAWLIARPTITAPIVSATNTNQLQEIIAAVALKLDSHSIHLLDQASN